jgi:hypothetical protein
MAAHDMTCGLAPPLSMPVGQSGGGRRSSQVDFSVVDVESRAALSRGFITMNTVSWATQQNTRSPERL